MRTIHSLSCRFLFVSLLLLTTLCAQGAPMPWGETNSPARFIIEPDDANAKGTVGSVSLNFPNPDWESHFHIYDETGKYIRSELLWNAPGEPATVIFDTASNSRSYYLYATPDIQDAKTPWEPQAGVLLETRAGDGKTVDNFEQMTAAWGNSKTIFGRSMLKQIFEGGHRHGPQENILSLYTGSFELTAPTKCEFAVVSVDAGFLLIDGKKVVGWPGRHWINAGLQGKFRGSVDLLPGIHKLEYYNAYVSLNENRPLVCCIAAKIGDGAWGMLTPDVHFFRPIVASHISHYELHPPLPPFVPGGPPQIILPPAPAFAISWNITGQSVPTPETVDVGLIAAQFNVLSPQPKGTAVWTFDDGTTAKGNKVDHLYARPGMKTVKVSFMDGDKETAALTQNVSIHSNWTLLTTRRPELNPKHKEAILARDPSTLSAADISSCIQVFQTFEDADAITKIIPGISLRAKEMNEKDLTHLFDASTYLSSSEVRRFAEANQILKAISENPASPALLVDKSRLLSGKNLLNTTDQIDDVIALEKNIHPETLPPDQHRAYDLLQGDILLAKGDVDGTKKQYLKLMGDPQGVDARSSIRRTARIDQARSFIDKKDYETAEKFLTDIEWETPIEKLSSDFALTRIRLLRERGDTKTAYLQAKRMLPFLTMPGTRSDLLFQAADLAFLQGDKDFAQKTLNELIQKNPYSEATAQAKQKWPAETAKK